MPFGIMNSIFGPAQETQSQNDATRAGATQAQGVQNNQVINFGDQDIWGIGDIRRGSPAGQLTQEAITRAFESAAQSGGSSGQILSNSGLGQATWAFNSQYSYRARPLDRLINSLNHMDADLVKEIMIEDDLYMQLIETYPMGGPMSKKSLTWSVSGGIVIIKNKKYILDLDSYLEDIRKEKLP